MSNKQGFREAYSSLSGIDIKAVIGGVAFANLQAISFSITREKAPWYSMGSPSPRGYARGKRGIAGSMVFIMIDEHAILTGINSVGKVSGKNYGKHSFVVDKNQRRPEQKFTDLSQFSNTKIDLGANAKTTTIPAVDGFVLSTPGVTNLDQTWNRSSAWYVDQLPPFDVTLTGVNELGHAATMSVIGAEFMNEGYGISIDDIVSEQQVTYVAIDILHWRTLTGNEFQKGLTGRLSAQLAPTR